MNNLKSDLRATVAIASPFQSRAEPISFSPANGTGKIKCKATEVDGAWLSREGSNGWVDTNSTM